MGDQYNTRQTSEIYKDITVHFILLAAADTISNTSDRNYIRYSSGIQPAARRLYVCRSREPY
jgi:hypothetical protein